MEKGAKIFNLVGYLFEILLGMVFLFFFAWSIYIVLPSSKDAIIEMLNDGTIKPDPSMSINDYAEFLQKTFIVVLIVMFLLSALFITESVIAIIVAKKEFHGQLLIISLVLSILSMNALLIVGCILGIKSRDVVVIETR